MRYLGFINNSCSHHYSNIYLQVGIVNSFWLYILSDCQIRVPATNSWQGYRVPQSWYMEVPCWVNLRVGISLWDVNWIVWTALQDGHWAETSVMDEGYRERAGEGIVDSCW